MVAGLCYFAFSSFRDEETPCEKTKRRHAKRRKDEKTPYKKMKDEMAQSSHHIKCSSYCKHFDQHNTMQGETRLVEMFGQITRNK